MLRVSVRVVAGRPRSVLRPCPEVSVCAFVCGVGHVCCAVFDGPLVLFAGWLSIVQPMANCGAGFPELSVVVHAG
eukprot:COSAG01_NODE_7052_length_3375_cov_25.892857_1_plen_75_part_00